VTALLLAGVLAGTVTADDVHRLVAERRGTVVLLQLWASWCQPCVAEFPLLAQVAKERPGVQVVSVSVDDPQDLPTVEATIARLAPPFPVFAKAPGPDEPFINAVDKGWSGVLPALLIYDRDGRRARLLSGEQPAAEIARAVDRALASPASRPSAAGATPAGAR
jgi:thiol-disulfide isomerase/thioredoxin